MAKINVLNTNGEKVKDITLNKEVFGIVPNDAVLYDAIKLAQNNARQGTRGVKGRSDVSGGGRKPWRQKGTGRARQGSTRAPHWYHGGWAFGNQTRNYEVKQNRKERALALKSALAYKVINKELVIVDSLNVETNKTKDMKNILGNFKVERNALIIVSELNDNLILATRNLNNVLLLEASEVNVLDLVSANLVIVEESAIKEIEEALV
ncbi:MAG: 50S ribosomal protein L4 [Bacilli bacterium]|nr:50S ribosomal protein L4 [Bacilli bacterium]